MHIILGTFVNAWDIQRGLKKEGIHAALYGKTDNPFVLKHKDKAHFYFTDEFFLNHAIENFEGCFYPKNLKISVDHKLIFHDYLVSIGEKPVHSFALDAYEKQNYPLVLKAKYSWNAQQQRVLRGRVCLSTEDVNHFLMKAEKAGFSKDDYLFQEYIPDGIINNVSVCGFYDFEDISRNFLCVTQKKLAVGRGGFDSSAIVIETRDDLEFLKERTASFLKHLNYVGPFELEFLYDEKEDCYKILELNPRFWMQHGFIIDHFDNAVIKAYLKKPFNQKTPHKKIIWVCSTEIIFGLLFLRKYILKLIFCDLLKYKKEGYTFVFAPSFFKACCHCMHVILKGVLKRIKKCFF